MQTLTCPASIPKRKQACRSCRHRKKRCDGEKPSCSLCKKWGARCEYNVPAANAVDAFIPTFEYPKVIPLPQAPLPLEFDQDSTFDFFQQPSFKYDALEANLDGFSFGQLNFPTPQTGPYSVPELDVSELAAQTTLPSQDVLLELVDIFFERFYHNFPCFHKATFLEQVRNQFLQVQSPLVLYAMCTLAARHHHDLAIRALQDEWYEHSKFLYEMTKRDPDPALRTIQAVLLLVFFSWGVGDFSAGWLYLGKAWRQAVALGLRSMDASRQIVFLRAPQWPETPLDTEEHRRTLWLLFIMDRSYSWPTGWPNAIDERQFKVDFPVDEATFQAMTPETTKGTFESIPFNRNLDSLISSSSSTSQPLNTFHHLAVAHVLLGRLAEHIHSLHDTPDSPEYARTAADIDAYLVKFRLSLPRSATSIVEASDEDRGLVIWLTVTVNMMAILLHHRCASEEETQEQFARAVLAAKNTVQIIKDASRTNIDLLLSAHVGSSLYIAACILVIQWRISGDESLKADIDLFSCVFDRFNEVYSFLGLKFKFALEYNLKNASQERILTLRESGFRGLLADCSKWSFVKAEMDKLGLGHKLT